MRLSSSLRTRGAEETLALARAAGPALGLSRVAEITRMDRLGVPVFTSIRPRGRTLRVHAGKGLRAVEAEVGAWMEAIEHAVAEAATGSGPDTRATVDEIEAQFGGRIALADFAPVLGRPIARDRVLPATRCESLGRGECLLPSELVLMPFDDGLFGWSGNGLASGNTVEEATLHALFEVLERDATAMNRARDESLWVDPASLPEPFAGWAAAWQREGIALVVRALPNDFGLPCFSAHLHEEASGVYLAAGHGLHADAGIALARAVCEAAQSRLSFIHGGRDDIGEFFNRDRRAAPERETERRVLARLGERGRSARFADVAAPLPADEAGMAGESLDDPAAVLHALLAHLQRRGFGPVFRHVYRGAPAGLHVVRAIVPRCENAVGDCTRVGPRLAARLGARG